MDENVSNKRYDAFDAPPGEGEQKYSPAANDEDQGIEQLLTDAAINKQGTENIEARVDDEVVVSSAQLPFSDPTETDQDVVRMDVDEATAVLPESINLNPDETSDVKTSTEMRSNHKEIREEAKEVEEKSASGDSEIKPEVEEREDLHIESSESEPPIQQTEGNKVGEGDEAGLNSGDALNDGIREQKLESDDETTCDFVENVVFVSGSPIDEEMGNVGDEILEVNEAFVVLDGASESHEKTPLEEENSRFEKNSPPTDTTIIAVDTENAEDQLADIPTFEAKTNNFDDVVSVKSLKSLVAEVGICADVESLEGENALEATDQESDGQSPSIDESFESQMTPENEAPAEVAAKEVELDSVIIDSQVQANSASLEVKEADFELAAEADFKKELDDEFKKSVKAEYEEATKFEETKFSDTEEVVDFEKADEEIAGKENKNDEIFVIESAVLEGSALNEPTLQGSESHEPVESESELRNSGNTDKELKSKHPLSSASELSKQRFNTSIDTADPLRRDSFSSISSFGARQDFRAAVDNFRQAMVPFEQNVIPQVEEAMDSPSSDLSPNDPPQDHHGFFDEAKNEKNGSHTAEGSLDSSGFEKVDHDALDEYSNQFTNQMQQSVFGSLSGDGNTIFSAASSRGGFELDAYIFDMSKKRRARVAPQPPVVSPDEKVNELRLADGFLVVDMPLSESACESPDDGGCLLHRTPSDIQQMPRENVVEKNYEPLQKLLDSPIEEEARRIVHEVVESAQERTPLKKETDHQNYDDFLGHGVQTMDSPRHSQRDQFNDFPQAPSAQHAYEDLLDIRDDVIEHALPEDVGTDVEKLHDEIDNFLHRKNEPYDVSAGGYTKPSEDDGLDRPDFRNQTPESEEPMFDRKGPLTIPEQPERELQEELAKSGFETIPRPPTPPKVISEEDVKPSVVNLGPAPDHGHHHPHRQPHSILKSSLSGEPWFDFKSVDPRRLLLCWRRKMSKIGAVSRGFYSLITFLVHAVFRIGINLSLVASVAMTVYAVGKFSSEALKQRKEILDLIYWRDPKKSGIALGVSLVVLFVIGRYPLLSVIAYTGIAVLAATLGFRVFKTIEGQVKKTGGENPFQEYLAHDMTLPQERVHAQVDVLVEHGTVLANQLKRLIFVESIVDSAKFGLLLWSLTYIASWFSGFALAFISIIVVFSVPKLYETYQDPIDAHLAVIQQHIQNVTNLLEEKLPFLRRQAPVEKKDQ